MHSLSVEELEDNGCLKPSITIIAIVVRHLVKKNFVLLLRLAIESVTKVNL